MPELACGEALQRVACLHFKASHFRSFSIIRQGAFHIRQHDRLIENWEGYELPNLDAARQEAILTAREMLADRVKKGEVIDDASFEICDGDRQVLATIPFKDALLLN